MVRELKMVSFLKLTFAGCYVQYGIGILSFNSHNHRRRSLSILQMGQLKLETMRYCAQRLTRASHDWWSPVMNPSRLTLVFAVLTSILCYQVSLFVSVVMIDGVLVLRPYPQNFLIVNLLFTLERIKPMYDFDQEIRAPGKSVVFSL